MTKSFGNTQIVEYFPNFNHFYVENLMMMMMIMMIMMLMMTMMRMDYFCRMVDPQKAFSLISSRNQTCQSKTVIIGNLPHASSRIWTCAEPKLRLSWMKLSSSDNRCTTVLWYPCILLDRLPFLNFFFLGNFALHFLWKLIFQNEQLWNPREIHVKFKYVRQNFKTWLADSFSRDISGNLSTAVQFNKCVQRTYSKKCLDWIAK